MLLEKNGRSSKGNITIQINIRHLLMLDRVKSGEVSIKYFPMENMIREYFINPLQGSKFRKINGKLLNIQISNDGTVPTLEISP